MLRYTGGNADRDAYAVAIRGQGLIQFLPPSWGRWVLPINIRIVRSWLDGNKRCKGRLDSVRILGKGGCHGKYLNRFYW